MRPSGSQEDGPEHGFIRLHCFDCGTDRLLPFSCKTRGVCASCGAKRSAAWAAWVRDDVARGVPHRQIVLVLPKLLRRAFLFRRELLTRLSRWLYEATAELLLRLRPEEDVRPGAVACVQLAGNLFKTPQAT